MKSTRLRLTLVAALALQLPRAHALDLLEAWQSARDHAPAAASAAAARAVGAARRAEGDTLWRPSVMLSAAGGLGTLASGIHGAGFSAPGFGTANGASFNSSIDAGPTTHVALEARQPLYNPVRQAEIRQLGLADEAAERQQQAAIQQLIVDTAEQYFAVVLGERRLLVLGQEQQAVEYAQARARARFAAGEIPITDTHEVNARAEAIRAERLSLESDNEYRRAALADSLGMPVNQSTLIAPAADPAAPPLAAQSWWIEQARTGNPALLAQQVAVRSAREEAAKLSHEASASVDLVAQLSHDRMSGSGDYGSAGTTARNGMLGVQLTIPLSTGGNRDARQVEAQRLADQAQAQAEQARQETELAVRHLWLGLDIAPARLRALAAALEASRARLDSTRTGHQVGDRTTLDLLDAESDAARAELALTEARVGVLLDRLRLAQLAGLLDDQHLRAENTLLTASAAPAMSTGVSDGADAAHRP